jgi:hypothetical protein
MECHFATKAVHMYRASFHFSLIPHRPHVPTVPSHVTLYLSCLLASWRLCAKPDPTIHLLSCHLRLNRELPQFDPHPLATDCQRTCGSLWSVGNSRHALTPTVTVAARWAWLGPPSDHGGGCRPQKISSARIARMRAWFKRSAEMVARPVTVNPTTRTASQRK